MRPSKSKIQEVIQAHLHKDEKGEYLFYDEAEQMLEEEILPEFIGITAQYKSSASGNEILVISSATGRSEYARYRIKRLS